MKRLCRFLGLPNTPLIQRHPPCPRPRPPPSSPGLGEGSPLGRCRPPPPGPPLPPGPATPRSADAFSPPEAGSGPAARSRSAGDLPSGRRGARGSAQPDSPLPRHRGRLSAGRPPTALLRTTSLTLKGLLRSGSAKGLLSKSDMAGGGGRCDQRVAALPCGAPTLAASPAAPAAVTSRCGPGPSPPPPPPTSHGTPTSQNGRPGNEVTERGSPGREGKAEREVRGRAGPGRAPGSGRT